MANCHTFIISNTLITTGGIMGLDMYAYATWKASNNERLESVLVNNEDAVEREDLADWRKHNALHGWMEDLYESQGGQDSFNCIPLQLFEEDLTKLEADINKDLLKGRSGSFWGNSEYSEEDKQYHKDIDLEFITKARIALSEGKDVFYDSWW